MATPSLTTGARIVVIGGGIVGTSVAYHLCHLGYRNVLLLEQGKLAGGTTWHAAGMVGRLRASRSMTRVNELSARLYAALEEETGISTGWRQVGSLMLARTAERMEQYRRTTGLAASFGIDARLVSAEEAKELCPIMNHEDLLGAVWLEGDGRVVPEDTVLSLAEGARLLGAEIREGVRVENICVQNGRAVGVLTGQGMEAADRVVLCGGMWARQLALLSGVNIPLWPVEHHYVVSESIDGVHDDLPCTRDPDGGLYFRSEGDAIVVGAFQEESHPWMVERVPDDFSFQLLDEDWDALARPLEEARKRVPLLEGRKFERFVNGPESFTPDNDFLLGETPEVRDLFVAAGFNSAGIACAGGAGQLLAEWMRDGNPPVDLAGVDIRRFTPEFNDSDFLKQRVAEVLGMHYRMAWPNRELKSGRPLRTSALHERLEREGACFGSKMGMERPLYFSRRPETAGVRYSFGKQNWFVEQEAEHRAARESVALFDQSSFSRFRISGSGALSLLQRLCGNDVDVEPGRVVYTGLFNSRGTFESDVCVVREEEEVFQIVSGAAQRIRDADWIIRHRKEEEGASLEDITAGAVVIGVMGPNARALLSRVSDVNFETDSFPFGTARVIEVAGVGVFALRVSYVGEPGWELQVEPRHALAVYETLFESGEDLGVVNAGHYAINSLRLEKAYRAVGAELTADDTPLEAGLSFAVAYDKGVDFLGRDSLLRQREEGIGKRLATFVLEGVEAQLWGGETIFRDGERVGYTTSGSFGHHLGHAVGLGYVRHPEVSSRSFLEGGRYELEVSGERVEARIHLRPPYDPDRKRLLS